MTNVVSIQEFTAFRERDKAVKDLATVEEFVDSLYRISLRLQPYAVTIAEIQEEIEFWRTAP